MDIPHNLAYKALLFGHKTMFFSGGLSDHLQVTTSDPLDHT